MFPLLRPAQYEKRLHFLPNFIISFGFGVMPMGKKINIYSAIALRKLGSRANISST
jgi:hypothetical protein